jgi:hypothetical protein
MSFIVRPRLAPFPAAVVLAMLLTGPALAQRGCGSRMQASQSSLQARYYGGQSSGSSALLARQYYAQLQGSGQLSALQSYALQVQLNALQQQALLAQLGRLTPAQLLALQQQAAGLQQILAAQQ